MASSKRQTTFAKITREQAVKERRLRKQEKKDSRKQAAADLAAGVDTSATAPEAAADETT